MWKFSKSLFKMLKVELSYSDNTNIQICVYVCVYICIYIFFTKSKKKQKQKHQNNCLVSRL